ncbi:hypothetical protein AMAG_00226 [Allomyces macrogynus ATCC 38327]|uniref:C2H2-type domain-containing protein n=1 Tax=Allomyces macrogynus (strain ATCC 38327) TaxID=578462 RepID=A0A0L0RVW8_ALLM3|nr:hypothetical protein AMAG_00226 [Allomyces macrogynus ATCC 38327]|eukprot:KNE54236.1 hypothetical protein AMAG_00226 [Allomyces macrogynus ATCC 38327]
MPMTTHAGPRPPAGRLGTTTARSRGEYMHPDKDPEADDRYHGFHFRRRRDRINWRLIGAVDVARVQREIDLGALQEVMDNVAYCDIESEDLRYTDPNFVKLFQLAQLVIEYLLHCQDVLHSSDQGARRQATEFAAEVDHLQQQNEKQLLEIYALKKETKSLKKTIFAYQIMTKTPGFHTAAAGNGTVVADRGAGRVTSPIAVEFHRCRYCPKVFNSLGYLDGHLRRRHADLPHYLDDERHLTSPPLPAPPAPPAPAEPDVDPSASAQADLIDRLTRTIEDFGQKLHATEAQLQADMEDRLHRELAAKQAELEEAHNRDWDAWRAQVHDELEAERALIAQEREKLAELQRSIEEKQLHLPKVRASSLVPLEDERDEVIQPVAEAEPVPPAVDMAAVVAQIEARQREGLTEMQATVAKEIQALREMMNRDQANQQVSNELKTTAQRLESLQQAIFDRQVSVASVVTAPPVPPPVVQVPAPVEGPVWQPPPPAPAPVMPPSLHGSRELLAQDSPQPKTPKKPKKKPAPPALQLPPPSSYDPDGPPSFLDDVNPHFDPSQTDAYDGDCDWPIISRHLRTHKHVPLPYAPWARAAIATHPAVSVVKERESIKVQLQRAMHQLGITREALLDEQATDFLVERLERDKDEKVHADPSYGFAYELICDDVDAVTDRHFRFKPKPTRLVPPRGGRFANVGNGGGGGGGGNGGTARFQGSAAAARARSRLATNSPARLILRSVLKSPDGSGRRTPSINSHLGSPGTPRRVEWKDAASDDSDSDSDDNEPPKSSTSRFSRHGGGGWGQASATPPSWRTSAGGGGTRNGGVGGKGGSWGMGGGTAHAKSRPARSSPLKQSFTASTLRKPDMAGVVVDAMRAAAPAAGAKKQWNRAGSNGDADDVPTPTAALTSSTYRPQAPHSATPTEAGMRKAGSNASMVGVARPSWGEPAPPPAAAPRNAPVPVVTVHHDDEDESEVIGDKNVEHFDVSADDDESEVAPPPAAAPVARARTITSAPVPVQVADTSVGELMQDLASDSETTPEKRKSRPPPINTRVIQSKPANNFSAWDDD